MRGMAVMLLGLVGACGGEDSGAVVGGGPGRPTAGLSEPSEALYFPWPPPRASATARIPSDFFMLPDQPTTLGAVARRLERALNEAGYETQYYAVPGSNDSVPSGFALVTSLEQITATGAPRPEPDRWMLTTAPPRDASLWEYLKTIIRGNPGRYRVIVFVVTTEPLRQDTTQVTRAEATEWLYNGWLYLPEWIGDMPYAEGHRISALIYEFVQGSIDSEPAIVGRSQVPGRMHLHRAGVWPALGD